MPVFDTKTQRQVIIWTAGILALAFIGLVYFEWGRGGVSPSSANFEVARINGVSIYMPEFRMTYEKIKESYSDKLSSENPEQLDREIMMMALRSLIQKYLLLQSAKKAKVSVSESEVTSSIIRMKEFRTESGEFNEYLYKMLPSTTKRRLENNTKDELVTLLFQWRLLDSAKVSDFDLRLYFQEKYTQRKIRFVLLKTEKKEQQGEILPALDEDRLKIEKRIDSFIDALKKSRDFTVAANLTGLNIYYSDYFTFFGPIKKVDKEERFNDLEIQDVYQKAFSLKKGEVSDKISLPDGYAVIQVIDAKEPDWNKFYYELPKLKAELENRYKNYKFEQWAVYSFQNSKIINNIERLLGPKSEEGS